MKCLALLGILLIFSQVAYPQLPFAEGREYTIAGGESLYMPLGKISFADAIVSFTLGSPEPLEEFRDPEKALGEPDYLHYKVPKYVSLGCKGSITVVFTDNGFIDMEGPDLYIWEVGPSAESFTLEISQDGQDWRNLGTVHGGNSFVDISSAIEDGGEIFYYIRITDLGEICTGRTPGADIDAVGTISGVIKINLSADVLFDFDKYKLKESAKKTVEELAEQVSRVGVAEIIIQGHTDSDGSQDYNLLLSENRAESVLRRLKDLLADSGIYTFKTEAYGEFRPRASNETADGKQLNRRVEIVVLPHKDFYKKK